MKVKDKKIQFYLPERRETALVKSYPYSKVIYDRGGLWAYIRTLQAKEKYSFGADVDDIVLSVEINHNTVIDGRYKALYRGAVYECSPADNYEGYIDTTKFTLTKSQDNNTYVGSRYTDTEVML